jgi:hypothetical protein
VSRNRKLTFNQQLTVYGLWLAAASIVVTIGVSIADRLYPSAVDAQEQLESLGSAPLMLVPQERDRPPPQKELEDVLKDYKNRPLVTERDVPHLSSAQLAELVRDIDNHNHRRLQEASGVVASPPGLGPRYSYSWLGWKSTQQLRMATIVELDRRGAPLPPKDLAQVREQQWRKLFDITRNVGLAVAALAALIVICGAQLLRRDRRKVAVMPRPPQL